MLKQTEVLLTIQLEGRLGSPLPKNKNGNREKQKCVYSILWKAPQVEYLTSKDSIPKEFKTFDWIKMSHFQKLLVHAKLFAQDITHQTNPKIHLELIQHKD